MSSKVNYNNKQNKSQKIATVQTFTKTRKMSTILDYVNHKLPCEDTKQLTSQLTKEFSAKSISTNCSNVPIQNSHSKKLIVRNKSSVCNKTVKARNRDFDLQSFSSRNEKMELICLREENILLKQEIKKYKERVKELEKSLECIEKDNAPIAMSNCPEPTPFVTRSNTSKNFYLSTGFHYNRSIDELTLNDDK